MPLCLQLYHKPIRQYRSLLHHHNAILDGIQRMIGILQMIAAVDAYIVADAAILVDNGIAYITTLADAELGQPAGE